MVLSIGGNRCQARHSSKNSCIVIPSRLSASLSTTRRTCRGTICSRLTPEARRLAAQKSPRSHGSCPTPLEVLHQFGPKQPSWPKSPRRENEIPHGVCRRTHGDSMKGTRRAPGNSGIPKKFHVSVGPIMDDFHNGLARLISSAQLQQRPHVVGEVHPCRGRQYLCMRVHSNMYPGD